MDTDISLHILQLWFYLYICVMFNLYLLPFCTKSKNFFVSFLFLKDIFTELSILLALEKYLTFSFLRPPISYKWIHWFLVPLWIKYFFFWAAFKILLVSSTLDMMCPIAHIFKFVLFIQLPQCVGCAFCLADYHLIAGSVL